MLYDCSKMSSIKGLFSWQAPSKFYWAQLGTNKAQLVELFSSQDSKIKNPPKERGKKIIKQYKTTWTKVSLWQNTDWRWNRFQTSFTHRSITLSRDVEAASRLSPDFYPPPEFRRCSIQASAFNSCDFISPPPNLPLQTPKCSLLFLLISPSPEPLSPGIWFFFWNQKWRRLSGERWERLQRRRWCYLFYLCGGGVPERWLRVQGDEWMDVVRREASDAYCSPLGTCSQGQCLYHEIARAGLVFLCIS